ncbi:MAG TPA: ABC transporter permease [Acidimicrobiales bacterium]|nr:ABC transporter permease [Acidimicrobiales bacterium]
MSLARSAAATQATVGGISYGPGAEAARDPRSDLARDRGELPQRVVSAKVSLRRRILEIWGSRELLGFLVRKELKVRYKNSVLGFVWSFLNPALILMIYYVVFKYFLHNPTPDFALFLFAGLLPWNLFNNSLLSSSGVLVAHAGIVKKVAFPREILALSQVGTAICYFFFQTCILVVFLAGFQVLPAFGYIPLLLFALVCDVILSAALAVFLSAVNVYLRDVQHLVEVLLVALFFSPPIVYAFADVAKALHDHAWFRWIYEANPLMWIVVSFQRCLFGKVIPPAGKIVKNVSPLVNGRLQPYHVLPTWGATPYWTGLACVLVGSIAMLLIAMVIFGRVEGNFAEEL